jgi:hypothetical protein
MWAHTCGRSRIAVGALCATVAFSTAFKPRVAGRVRPHAGCGLFTEERGRVFEPKTRVDA